MEYLGGASATVIRQQSLCLLGTLNNSTFRAFAGEMRCVSTCGDVVVESNNMKFGKAFKLRLFDQDYEGQQAGCLDRVDDYKLYVMQLVERIWVHEDC